MEQYQNPVSLAPIIKLMMTESNMALRYFKLPYHGQLLWRDFLEKLVLEKWAFELGNRRRLSTKKGGRMAKSRDGFIVETADDYIMLQSIPMEPRCTCERISKKNVDEFVVKWARFYLRVKIPYDISALCDYIRENQDNFEGVRQYMLKFMRIVYSYKL